MRTWSVRLTTLPAPEELDIEQLSDDLLSALLADPRAAAACLSTDLHERRLSPHFDVESEGAVEDAIALAVMVLGDAGRSLGWTPEVAAVDAEAVEEPVPA